MRVLTLVALAWAGAISSGCKEGSTSQAPDAVNETPGTPPLSGSETSPGGGPTRFQASKVTELSEPWAMTFLPDGRLLVTERRGSLKRVSAQGDVETVTGVPTVAYGGQGGLGDVILHPAFGSNGLVYLSWAEGGSGGSYGAVVGRAKFVPQGNGGRLENVEVIWRQAPKVSGQGHYSHRLAFGPDGFLWITSGERQKLDPAQDMSTNLGKVIRLREDGAVPGDNPFFAQGGVAAQVWSLGHRNLLGIAFDESGRLWTHEMGPKGGDELNRIERGSNYGYPLVSNGDNYDGSPIPDHDTRPDLNAPEVSWNPVISPAGLIIYSGNLFPAWRGNAFVGGLSSKALIRIEFAGEGAREAQRFDMGKRIREVEQGPDGAIWVLEDGADARLLKLTPAP